VRLSLALLGPFHATVDGEPLPVSQAGKIEALLVYLAMEAGHPHSRTYLGGILFPEVPDEQARTNLRQTVARLRRAVRDDLADPVRVLLTRETIQFNTESDHDLDVHAFLARLRGCHRHDGRRADRCSDCMRRLEEAVTLYRGPFLEGFFVRDSEAFETWMQTTRERLHQKALDTLHRLAGYYERRGEYGQAQAHARRQLELDPWHEGAHRRLMRLLARQGRRSTALAQYERCRRALAEELGVGPSPQTEALHARIRAAGEARPHNLPAPTNRPFVGRSTEMARVREHLVAPEHRLLTLAGPGGVGKTQLALRIAHAVAAEYLGPFMHGVHYVPLISADSTDELSTVSFASAIARALTLPLSGRDPPRQQVIRALREKECLLVVDNGEHLDANGLDLIVSILQQTISVQILVTSRERLNLAEEWVLEVEGLPFPEHPARQRCLAPPAPNPEVEAFDAVRLFVQRARQTERGFALNNRSQSERAAIVRISHLTRGLPLAIEMAAAWAHVLSCEQIAQEIKKSLDILASTRRDLPARHRSIRGVFEHSWQMLTPSEQRTLVQLSVFCGSFGHEAAGQVAGATLATLSALRDRSLLQSVGEQEEKQCEMHPLLRQFAAEKAPRPLLNQARARHASHYGRFLDERRERLGGPLLPETLQEIEREINNVRAGWHWAVGTRTPSTPFTPRAAGCTKGETRSRRPPPCEATKRQPRRTRSTRSSLPGC
jgi:DNA-binding SARP family transcriptional activator/predicted ATPase